MNDSRGGGDPRNNKTWNSLFIKAEPEKFISREKNPTLSLSSFEKLGFELMTEKKIEDWRKITDRTPQEVLDDLTPKDKRWKKIGVRFEEYDKTEGDGVRKYQLAIKYLIEGKYPATFYYALPSVKSHTISISGSIEDQNWSQKLEWKPIVQAVLQGGAKFALAENIKGISCQTTEERNFFGLDEMKNYFKEIGLKRPFRQPIHNYSIYLSDRISRERLVEKLETEKQK